MNALKHIYLLLWLLLAAGVNCYAQRNGVPGYPIETGYGVNNFGRVTVHELPNGLTRFFLPNRLDAKRVMLSGSFNDWSTLEGVMLKTDSGWIRDVHLDPDIYNYKFIIDGNWRTDEYNNLVQNDGAGNLNSVYYRYNFTFKLPGHGDAHRVVLTGDFNKWQQGNLIMNRVADGWEIKLYIHEGKHEYHFLVDGKLVNNPVEKVNANNNSVLNLGEAVDFKLAGYQNAKQVYLCGSFNNWNGTELPMKKTIDGWVLRHELTAGNYQYGFWVDGSWVADPANPHSVRSKKEYNSLVSVNPNTHFYLKGYPDAKKVILSGTFNDWNQNGYTMERKDYGWDISLRLPHGKTLYKFIIDGGWIVDPSNKLREPNVQGTGNSVLWVN